MSFISRLELRRASVELVRQMSIKPLLNQHAFITGGSKGIGSAIAAKLSSLGCRVTILARNQDLLKAQTDQLNHKYPLPNGEKHSYVKFDLLRPSELEKFISEGKCFHRTNILVNCAGMTQKTLLMTTSPQEIADIINVNLTSPIILSKLFVKSTSRVKDPGYNASIVNISSVVSVPGNNLTGASVYTATKAALTRFTQALAAEQPAIHDRRPLSPLVRVNVLLPRHIADTDIGKSVKTPSVGTSTAEDVAQAVADLVTDDHNVGGAATVV